MYWHRQPESELRTTMIAAWSEKLRAVSRGEGDSVNDDDQGDK
jgi:hypothetical protein